MCPQFLQNSHNMKKKNKTKKISKLKLIIIIGAIIYVCYGLWVSYARAMQIQRSTMAQIEEKQRIEEMSVKELIVEYGGVYSATINTIAYCESRLNPKAINYHDGGKNKHSVGILQFQEATFKEWSGRMGQQLDYYSTLDQIKVARYMIENGQARQWTCSYLTGVVKK